MTQNQIFKPQLLRKKTTKLRLSKVLITLATSVLSIPVIFAAFIFILDPAEVVLTKLIREVKTQTGRDLIVTGKPYLTFYPEIGIVLPNIAISSHPSMDRTPTLRAKRLQIFVDLLPLLSNHLVIKEVNLYNPKVNLHIDHKGHSSWKFSEAQRSTKFEIQTSSSSAFIATSSSAEPGNLAPSMLLPSVSKHKLDKIQYLASSEIKVHDGYLQYRDDRSGITEFISGVNINVTGRSSIDPIFIDGSLNWNEEPVTIKIRLETLSDILEDRSALIEFHMNSKPAIISFDGKVVSGTKTRAEGSILCLSSSVQKFMYWIGIDLPKGNSLGPARLTSKFVATPTNVALTEANFSIGKVRSSGDVVVGLESSRPRIKSNLTISRLDIDSILSFLEGARSIKSEKPNLVKKHKLEQPLKQSIEKSLVYPSSNKDELSFRKKNVSKTSPVWNDKNIFKKLAFFDVVLKGKILALDASGFLIDKADLKLKLDNGLFKLNLDRVKLYGGHGYGFMTAAVGDRGLKVGANFSMNEIAANNFLADLLGIQAINGTARFKANLNGRGYTKHDIISNLSGTASFIIKNGSIIGWNVPKLLRDLQSGKLGNVNQTKTAKTFFSDFSASFNINRGVANTQNLRVISPVVRMTGSGDIDLGKRQVDKILRSKLLTVLEDKPDTINLPGIEIPLRITGSWDKPDVQLDLAAILINEELVRETLDTVRKLTDKISDKTTGEIIRGIIGDDKENVPSLLLKKLFKH